MVRFNLYLQNDQFRYLKNISKNSASVSEYIRIAINEFRDKREREKLNVSKSLSKKE